MGSCLSKRPQLCYVGKSTPEPARPDSAVEMFTFQKAESVHPQKKIHIQSSIRPARLPFLSTDMERMQSYYGDMEMTHLKRGIMRFNDEPRQGILYLQRVGLLSSPLDAKVVASFIFHNGKLQHPKSLRILESPEPLRGSAIGEYLGSAGGKSEASQVYHELLLHEYTSLFDFSNMSISQALRVFLRAFHLPGESQIIDRIMMSFAKVYIRDNPSVFDMPAAAFPLASTSGEKRSISGDNLILNTDPESSSVNVLPGTATNNGPIMEGNSTLVSEKEASPSITQNNSEAIESGEDRIHISSAPHGFTNHQDSNSNVGSAHEEGQPLPRPDASDGRAKWADVGISKHSSPPLYPQQQRYDVAHSAAVPRARAAPPPPASTDIGPSPYTLRNLKPNAVHRSISMSSYSSTLSRLSEIPDDSPVPGASSMNDQDVTKVHRNTPIPAGETASEDRNTHTPTLSVASTPVATHRRDYADARSDSLSTTIDRSSSLSSTVTSAPEQPQYTQEDAPYILAFACILLNTDLHLRSGTSGNLPKMTKEMFIRNLRGAYHGSDFPKHLLSEIYDDIQANPLPGERDGIIAPFYSPKMSGWLYKHGRSGLVRWKRRYFILSDGCLYYFLSEESVRGGRPRCIMPLEGVSVHPYGRTEIRILPIPPIYPFLTNVVVEPSSSSVASIPSTTSSAHPQTVDLEIHQGDDTPLVLGHSSAHSLEGVANSTDNAHDGQTETLQPNTNMHIAPNSSGSRGSPTASLSSLKRPKRQSKLQQLLGIGTPEDLEILIPSFPESPSNISDRTTNGTEPQQDRRSGMSGGEITNDAHAKQVKRGSKQYVVLPQSLETPVNQPGQQAPSHAFYPSETAVATPIRDTVSGKHGSTLNSSIGSESSPNQWTEETPILPLFSPDFSKAFKAAKHKDGRVSAADIPAFITVAKFLANGELRSSRCPHMFLRAETEAERNAWLQALTIQLSDQHLAPHPSLYAYLPSGEQAPWVASPRYAWNDNKSEDRDTNSRNYDGNDEHYTTTVSVRRRGSEVRAIGDSAYSGASSSYPSDTANTKETTYGNDFAHPLSAHDIQVSHTVHSTAPPPPPSIAQDIQEVPSTHGDLKGTVFPLLLSPSSESTETSTASLEQSLSLMDSHEDLSTSSTLDFHAPPRHTPHLSPLPYYSPSTQSRLSTYESTHTTPVARSPVFSPTPTLVPKTSPHPLGNTVGSVSTDALHDAHTGSRVSHASGLKQSQRTEKVSRDKTSTDYPPNSLLSTGQPSVPFPGLEPIRIPSVSDAPAVSTRISAGVPLSALSTSAQYRSPMNREREHTTDSPLSLLSSPTVIHPSTTATPSLLSQPTPSPHVTKLLEAISASFHQRNELPELHIDEDETGVRISRKSFLDGDDDTSDDQDTLLAKQHSASLSSASYSGGASASAIPHTDTALLPISKAALSPSATPASIPWKMALDPFVTSIQLPDDNVLIRGEKSMDSGTSSRVSTLSSGLYGEQNRDIVPMKKVPATLLSQLRGTKYQSSASIIK